MAKSKSGGTRSYIRGKIGADVYSIGKDGKGAKQQVVRSLAEVVSNPQTALQMKGRMIMSTVMQAVSGLSQIIDHSFDGLPAGQPSISEFISRNYALIKADVEAHPSASNTFGLNKYQEKGMKLGAYIISNGKAQLINFTENQSTLSIAIVTSAQSANATIQNLLDVLGLSVNDKFTLVWNAFDGEGNNHLYFARFGFQDGLDLNGKIATVGVTNIFTFETNSPETLATIASYSNGTLSITPINTISAYGVITSKKTANGWEHSTTTMVTLDACQWTSAVALPTYPVGSQRFLNGGDL